MLKLQKPLQPVLLKQAQVSSFKLRRMIITTGDNINKRMLNVVVNLGRLIVNRNIKRVTINSIIDLYSFWVLRCFQLAKVKISWLKQRNYLKSAISCEVSSGVFVRPSLVSLGYMEDYICITPLYHQYKTYLES